MANIYYYRAIDKAKQNVKVLFAEVQRGRPIVVPGPTCSYVLKKEYPELLGTDEADLGYRQPHNLVSRDSRVRKVNGSSVGS